MTAHPTEVVSNPNTPEIEHHEPALKPERAKRIYLIVGGIALAAIVIYLIMRFIGAGKESTDDAQVGADVVPVAARVAGQVQNVYIHDNQEVSPGMLIAELDPRDAAVKLQQAQSDLATAEAQAADAEAKIAVTRASATGGYAAAGAAVASARSASGSSESVIAEARAAVARAQANAEKARLDFGRASELGAKGDIARAQVDAARAANEAAAADLAQARARLAEAQSARQLAAANIEQAEGKLQQSSAVGAQVNAAQAQARLARAKVEASRALVAAAQLTLSYTRIYAPAAGIASKLSVHPGSMVSIGQPLVQLVPRKTFVVANFKETQMRDVKVGQRVAVRIDMLGRREFEGRVESLSGGTGASFSLLPPDNASGNFVKVVQRVPVRISWNGPASDTVPVGSSAEVTVYTK